MKQNTALTGIRVFCVVYPTAIIFQPAFMKTCIDVARLQHRLRSEARGLLAETYRRPVDDCIWASAIRGATDCCLQTHDRPFRIRAAREIQGREDLGLVSLQRCQDAD